APRRGREQRAQRPLPEEGNPAHRRPGHEQAQARPADDQHARRDWRITAHGVSPRESPYSLTEGNGTGMSGRAPKAGAPDSGARPKRTPASPGLLAQWCRVHRSVYASWIVQMSSEDAMSLST